MCERRAEAARPTADDDECWRDGKFSAKKPRPVQFVCARQNKRIRLGRLGCAREINNVVRRAIRLIFILFEPVFAQITSIFLRNDKCLRKLYYIIIQLL